MLIPGPKKDSEWGGAGWVDPRTADPRTGAAGMDPRDLRPDPRDMRAGSTDPIRMLDPRDPRLVSGDMRGDPRGITGRLNGAGTEGFWTQPPQGPHHMHQPAKMMGPGGGGNGGGGGGNGAGEYFLKCFDARLFLSLLYASSVFLLFFITTSITFTTITRIFRPILLFNLFLFSFHLFVSLFFVACHFFFTFSFFFLMVIDQFVFFLSLEEFRIFI